MQRILIEGSTRDKTLAGTLELGTNNNTHTFTVRRASKYSKLTSTTCSTYAACYITTATEQSVVALTVTFKRMQALSLCCGFL